MSSSFFGGLFAPQTKDNDQMIGSVATTAVKAMFQKNDSLTIQVKAPELLKGNVDNFDLEGRGLVMRNGLRIQRMSMNVQSVALDWASALMGKIRLNKAARGSLRVVLTEQDLTAAYNTPFIIEKLQQLTFEGQALHFSNTRAELADGCLTLRSMIAVGNGEAQEVGIKVRVCLEDDRRLVLADPEFEGTEQAQLIAQAVLTHVNNLLDLDKFKLDGAKLRLFRCDILRGQIVLHGNAQFNHFPGMKAA
jgi:hypothetical protein